MIWIARQTWHWVESLKADPVTQQALASLMR
jgi:hypothetical protein